MNSVIAKVHLSSSVFQDIFRHWFQWTVISVQTVKLLIGKSQKGNDLLKKLVQILNCPER